MALCVGSDPRMLVKHAVVQSDAPACCQPTTPLLGRSEPREEPGLWPIRQRPEDTAATATRPVALIVLAAGAGTRMNSDLPKPLHELGGRPLVAHALAARGARWPPSM
jgi:hypothetical protein